MDRGEGGEGGRERDGMLERTNDTKLHPRKRSKEARRDDRRNSTKCKAKQSKAS